ncbi:putative bifunctional diguanylate cyclase/phosphodiesterase [Neptuniibacter caesariensis]|uniref:ATP-binding region, ATPase-like:Histidine kinase, HAMP region:Histidine kinase A, N-terminal n=1 Tax=Neptuniibacter caesariensis TaxID=207954 RepID=A0A7U8GS37_NEPCE|nr:EAL domain-containing protein [Neptuniibacter caesariensis]EAR60913.1 ATP-binding region, ATPase-like:Histidine kinase, HAMP region:Histidine kinase A, N-terminal [Oceanospirillum sp. MED92] [Neptuniibacter caesariensis]
MSASENKFGGSVWGIRGKLVALFVLIKVFPLILIAWLAWSQSSKLADILGIRYEHLSSISQKSVTDVGDLAVNDAVAALDEKARNEIERITTDTANAIAGFLYQRDTDVLLASALDISKTSFQNFISQRRSRLMDQGDWLYDPELNKWRERAIISSTDTVKSSLVENAKDFHSFPKKQFHSSWQPLYLEITYLDLEGREQLKVVSSELMTDELKDVSDKRNTFIKAESYFSELEQLDRGQIYVSEVIGEYVPSHVIGTYTPKSAAKTGIEYQPEQSAFAGRENPLGQKFRGIVRWATPVYKDEQKIGYVTLALDHRHIMAFTDHILPTEERYTQIPDASEGNYAFIWDAKGRNIAHPRHYFIAGYDAQTGDPQIPWMEQEAYAAWKESGLSYASYLQNAPTFVNQKLTKKPAAELKDTGLRALDCRFLNFAPQCTGWFDLTREGGSGSFVIFWSGLWKLTTAAAIPYYTGQYAESERGFGFVTVGANVDDFHKATVATKERIDLEIERVEQKIRFEAEQGRTAIISNLRETAERLSISTLLMILVVIVIAVWIASYLTKRITTLIKGIRAFRSGQRQFRFALVNRDEMGALASELDEMADDIDGYLGELEAEVKQRKRTEFQLLKVQDGLEERVAERTSELEVQVEERTRAEKQVRHLAEHDALTGLANRRGFQQELECILRKADTNGKKVALLLFDLDRFKEVNDTLGHAIGDDLLCSVADLLRANIRDEDIVARLGGDEFAIVMSNLASVDGVINTALRIIETLSKPLQLSGHTIRTGTSVGITVYPDDSGDPEQLMLHADLAMYQAKDKGGQCYQFFELPMHDKLVEQKRIENGLHRAIQDSEFCLYYQPRYDYSNSKLDGFEALIRWQCPERGLISPGDFLPVAQRSGLLPHIESWVLLEACQQALKWHQQGVSFGRVAVNVCAVGLQQQGFYERIEKALDKTGLPPELLEIEITERALIGRYDVVVDNLMRLKSLGVSIALDDLGAEHSSLQRLIECPIDVIKIDRFFIDHVGELKSEAVIAGLLAIAGKTEMKVVAEGVETKEQLDFLIGSGCYVVQGFYHAKPMPANEINRYMDSL